MFFGTHYQANAKEVIILDGDSILSNISFMTCHIEARTYAEDNGIKITGYLFGSSFRNCHFSNDWSTYSNIYGFIFDDADLRGCSFENNEFKGGTNTTACYRFENTTVLSITEPTLISRVCVSAGALDLLDVESGGNEDIIWNVLQMLSQNEVLRKIQLTNNTATAITPPTEQGEINIIQGGVTVGSGAVLFDADSSSPAISIAYQGSGNYIEVTTGILSGTTGTDAKLTISTHTDGKIYIENRMGYTNNINIRFSGLY